MTPSAPEVMLARHDVDPTFLRSYLDWYESMHAPDAIEMGHFTAQCYLVRLGAPMMCNVYESPDVAGVWEAASYDTIRSRDQLRSSVLARIARKSNTAYLQLASSVTMAETGEWAVGGRIGGITAQYLTTTEFDTNEPDQILPWFLDESERLGSVQGAKSTRLLRRSATIHPDTPSTEPEWTVLSEWTEVPALDSWGLGGWLALTESRPPSASRNQFCLASRVHALGTSSDT